jgi:hypothetical protein
MLASSDILFITEGSDELYMQEQNVRIMEMSENRYLQMINAYDLI